MKKLFLILILTLCIITSVQANCNLVLDKTSYFKGESVTATMQCLTKPEQNLAYVINWTNGTIQMHLSTGTTPNVLAQNFIATYNIPATFNGTQLTANLSVGGTYKNWTNTSILSGVLGNLIISNPTISGKYLGRSSSISAIVYDYTGTKRINGANCNLNYLSNDQVQVLAHRNSVAIRGDVATEIVLNYDQFQEGTSYYAQIDCYCGGTNGTITGCTDENGNTYLNQMGFTITGWNTNTWINFNDNNLPLANSSGSQNNTLSYYSGYSSVYWQRNTTNNFGSLLNTKIDSFIIDNSTGKVVYQIQDLGLIGIGNETKIKSILIPEYVTSGIYFVRNVYHVLYKELEVSEYIKETPTFNIIGVETQTIATSTFIKDRMNGLITTHPTLLNDSNEPTYNATNKLFIRKGYTARWCVNVTNLVPETNLSVGTTVYTYLIRASLFNPTLNTYNELTNNNFQYTPQGNSTMCFDIPIPVNLKTHSDYQIQYEISQGNFLKPFTCAGCSLAQKTGYFYIINSLLEDGITIINDIKYPMILVENKWDRTNANYGYWNININLSNIYKNYIDPDNKIVENDWDAYAVFTEEMPKTNDILNYSVTYANGTAYTDTEIKTFNYYDITTGITKQGRGIGIENINISNETNKYFIVTVYSPEYTKRQTNSLENINSTFFQTSNTMVQINTSLINMNSFLSDLNISSNQATSYIGGLNTSLYSSSLYLWNINGSLVATKDYTNTINVSLYNSASYLGSLDTTMTNTYYSIFSINGSLYLSNVYSNRSATALETIANKTGTFHLSLDCPSVGYKAQPIKCMIEAQVEDSQQVEKEVQFDCFINNTGEKVSEIKFLKMITKSPSKIEQSFLIPSNFISNKEYTIDCKANYYNLGSRSDSFSDTFTVRDDGGLTQISGGFLQKPSNYIVFVWLILLIIVLVFIFKKKKPLKDDNKTLI